MKNAISLALALCTLTVGATVARADYRTDNCAPGNTWDGTGSTGVGGAVPLAMLTESQDHMTVFGTSSGATVLHVLASVDDITYYDTGLIVTISGAGDFSGQINVQSVFIKLMSTNDVTITAAICAFGG